VLDKNVLNLIIHAKGPFLAGLGVVLLTKSDLGIKGLHVSSL